MDKYIAANAAFSLFARNYMDLKKDLPIRPSEMGVLNIITATPGPHTPVMLAGLLGVSKPMITAHLTVLANKGYIIRQACEQDKRVCYILPTEKALQLVESTKRDMERLFARMEETVGETGFDELIALIQTANKVLESGKGEKE